MKADIPITWKDALLVVDQFPAAADSEYRNVSNVMASATSVSIGTALKRNNVRCIGKKKFSFTQPQGQPDTNVEVNSIWTQDMSSYFDLVSEDEMAKDTNLFVVELTNAKIDEPLGDFLYAYNMDEQYYWNANSPIDNVKILGIGNAYCIGSSFRLSGGEVGTITTRYDAGNIVVEEMGIQGAADGSIEMFSVSSPVITYDGETHKTDEGSGEVSTNAVFKSKTFNAFDISGEYDKDIFTFKNTRVYIRISGSDEQMIPWHQFGDYSTEMNQEFLQSFSIDVSMVKKGLGEIGNRFAVIRKTFGSPQVMFSLDMTATNPGASKGTDMSYMTRSSSKIEATIIIEVDSRAGQTYRAEIPVRQTSSKYNGATSAGHSFSLQFESETIPEFTTG